MACTSCFALAGDSAATHASAGAPRLEAAARTGDGRCVFPAALPRPLPASLAFAASAGAALLWAQAQRVLRARELATHAPAVFARELPRPLHRVLLVGDSTGVGVGCRDAGESIAAHLARDFGEVEVSNLCVTGATVADVLAGLRELPAADRFDLVLVFAGGNDVLRRTRWRVLRAGRARRAGRAGRPQRHVLWAGMANVGLAPLFLPPFSWWMTDRTRRVNRLLAWQVRLAGARFVDFFRERDSDPFSAEPARYYAVDGVHPSPRAYAHCYAAMRPMLQDALR
jgi:lysophospholipase L1-like esterase